MKLIRSPIAHALLATLAAALVWGCGEDAVEGPEPVAKVYPAAPVPTYTEGHFTVAQRGFALDEEDLPVITETGSAGINVDRLVSEFGVLVLNRPYVDWRATVCPSVAEAEITQPYQRAVSILDALEQRNGARFDTVAVNVDLLTPNRAALYHVCFTQGSPQVSFGVEEHRRAVLSAFEDLARLDGLAYVTVGLDMNLLYHLQTADGQQRTDDYTNFITLYREIYAAVKAINPEIQVGPGINWSVLVDRTAPEMAAELGLERGSLASVYEAGQRTIAPLLTAGRAGAITADFVGVSMIPVPGVAPYGGEPAPEDEGKAQAIRDYYKLMPLVVGDLPIVLPQVDWPSTGTGGKAAFLGTIKEALSHMDIKWAAWLRLSDIPRQPPETSKCRGYTHPSEVRLAYPESYCNAGMIQASGLARDVLDEMTTDP